MLSCWSLLPLLVPGISSTSKLSSTSSICTWYDSIGNTNIVYQASPSLTLAPEIVREDRADVISSQLDYCSLTYWNQGVAKWNSRIWLVSILVTSARPSLTFLEGQRWSGLIDYTNTFLCKHAVQELHFQQTVRKQQNYILHESVHEYCYQ